MKINNEAKIGIFVVFAAVVLFVITWEAGDYDFSPQGYEMKVHFQNIDGVEKNAPVTLNGMEVGRVSDIEILYGDATRVELTLWLNQSAKLHHGSVATVRNMGFLGEKYVALTTGDDGKPFLSAGTIIQGKEPADFDKVIGEGEVIAKNIKEISIEINERLKVNSAAIDNIVGDMKTTMNNMASISDNVKTRLDVNSRMIDDFITNMDSASANLEEMTYDLKVNPWKLLYRPSRRELREAQEKEAE